MEVKLIRIQVLYDLRVRDSGEGNSGSRVTVKLMVGVNWMSDSKSQAGASDRDSRIVWFVSNGRQTARLGRQIGSQSLWEIVATELLGSHIDVHIQ